MGNITVEITCPEITSAIEKLAAELNKFNGSKIDSVSNPQEAVLREGTQITTVADSINADTASVPLAVPDPVPVAPSTAAQVPVSKPAYTFNQLARATAPLIDAGKINDIRGLLSQFNVPSLNVLKEEQYDAFANALRGLGAKL